MRTLLFPKDSATFHVLTFTLDCNRVGLTFTFELLEGVDKCR